MEKKKDASMQKTLINEEIAWHCVCFGILDEVHTFFCVG